MKELNNKQKIIVKNISSILEFLNEEQDWLSIAYECSLSDMDDVAGKLERILYVLLEKKQKIYNFTDKFWNDLYELL